MHCDFNNCPPSKDKIYDYLWIGEWVENSMVGAGKDYEQYVVPCQDRHRSDAETLEVYLARTIPFLQFPLLKTGRPIQGKNVDLPNVTYYGGDEQEFYRAVGEYMDEHPEVAACQPKIRSYHRRTFFEHAGACGGLMDEWGYPYCYGRMFDAVEEDNGQYELPMRIFWATGACLCIRSSCYHEVGGLDKDFFAHMEEIDLCWRLASRGWEVAYVPQSVVYHVGGGSLPKENPRKDYLNFRNNLLMLYKNLPKKRLWKVMMVRFFLDYMAALVFVLKGKWGSFRAVLKAR
jgi:hypothetical protein